MSGLNPGPAPARQSGVILITALIFLIVLTMLAVTAMQSATLEEKLAGHMRNEAIASQAAQAAVNDAIDWLESQTTAVVETNVGANTGGSGIWFQNGGNPTQGNTNPYENASWDSESTVYGGDPTDNTVAAAYTLSGVDVQPRYLISDATRGGDPVTPDCGRTTDTSPGAGTYYGCDSAACAKRYWIGAVGESNGIQVAYRALYNKCYLNDGGTPCNCVDQSSPTPLAQTSEGLSQNRLYGFYPIVRN